MKTLLLMTWKLGGNRSLSFGSFTGTEFRKVLDASLKDLPRAFRRELGHKALDMYERNEIFDPSKPLRAEMGLVADGTYWFAELAVGNCEVVE